MSHSELKQLTIAEELFDDGKLEEALEILNDRSQFEGLNPHQKEHYQFLKGLILFYQNKSEDLIILGEKIYEESQNRNDNLQSFDGLYFIITGLALAGKFEEAFKLFEKAKLVLKSISNVSKEIITQKKACLSVTKAFVGLHGDKVDLVEKSLVWILNSQEKFDKSFEIVWANLIMGSYLLRVKSKFDLGMEHIKKALSLAKEIKFNHYWIATCQIYLGVCYWAIGEMDKSLKCNIKSLELFKKIKSSLNIAILLNNIGGLYGEMGEYELAVEHLEESINLLEQIPQGFFSIHGAIDSLINLAVEHGDNERAQKYFHRLKNIYKQKKDERIEFSYKFNKALILKTSSRIRDKAKAEELFKEVVETDTTHFDSNIKAHIHLCDILLMEYRVENDSEILAELNHYIAKLLTIAEKQHSYLVFCETFILQAKLALLNFDIKSARLLLTQALKIAEVYSMKRLAMKISHEHDELLRQIKMWKQLKESEASLSERWKLARLNEQMEHMVKKRMIEAPKISQEDPVMILLLTEGGNLLFSKKFIEDFSFEEDILGGFFTTMNYIISEVFSEGLDRAVFGQYTLLMMPLQPFLICYIFKGDSYYAYHKIKNLLDSIQNDSAIWQSLVNFFKKSKSIQLNDIPSLESKIMEIFIEKKNA
ncbi:MAG: tetratricopeptide repeat protein [Promethearchaeota archaeon]|nr:MAG: tetratricopeptide repeat protein [Candidatus Lokiarchaeota archaeon]